jgi:hypothetical protein
MKHFLTLSFIALFCMPQLSFAEELSSIKDAWLVGLLNDFEILAEKTTERPYAIRILRHGERGECDGTPQSCPKTNLYIAVSTTFDEAPDQQVYKLPEAYGWEFVRWKVVARKEGRESYTILEMKRKNIAQDIAKGWWTFSTYEVSVNPWQGEFKEIQKVE